MGTWIYIVGFHRRVKGKVDPILYYDENRVVGLTKHG
jgi:hypothetical protein